MEEIKFSKKFLDSIKKPYFYDRLYYSLKECGVDIAYGDFSSRVISNGTIKVLKALGLYRVIGRGENKCIFVHERLKLIIDTTIESPEIIAKTTIELGKGKYVGLEKFKINDLSKFYAL